MKNYDDVLDKAAADNSVSFTVGMTGKSSGITCSGASGITADLF